MSPGPPPTTAAAIAAERYRMAPLIRWTLIALYLALTLPLPLLAPPGLRWPLAVALPLGLALVLAATSEAVELNAHGIRVGHPPWCAWLLRRGWELAWPEVKAITPVATSQGGRVYYLRSAERAYLLPQRIERFEAFLIQFEQQTGLPTGSIGRLTPLWTYQLLALLCGALLLGELAWALLGWLRPALSPGPGS